MASMSARAIERGFAFVHQVTTDRRYFVEYGNNFLWFYHMISSNSGDRVLRERALHLGREHARQWRMANPSAPADATAGDLYLLVSGSCAADQLGVHDAEIKAQLRRAVARFTATDFLSFNPLAEPVPDNVPEPCSACNGGHRRGVRICHSCGSALEMQSPYDILCHALIASYTFERYGIPLGARYADVMQWITHMRPYPVGESGTDAFNAVAYAITHVIYTLNDYGAWRLRAEWLPEEFKFLDTNIQQVVSIGDSETVGEFLSALRSFGMTEADGNMRAAVEFLLSCQNEDGSWGSLDTDDIYIRYHCTWTAMLGLMEYAGLEEGVSFPEALAGARGEGN